MIVLWDSCGRAQIFKRLTDLPNNTRALAPSGWDLQTEIATFFGLKRCTRQHLKMPAAATTAHKAQRMGLIGGLGSMVPSWGQLYL